MYNIFMSWDAEDIVLLKKLWAVGESAAQIARRLGYSRNAVCAKLTQVTSPEMRTRAPEAALRSVSLRRMPR